MTIPAIYTKSNPDYSGSTTPPRVTTLATMAQEILVRLNAVAAGAGALLPDRQIIYMTGVPLDCEQVAVAFGGWVPEPQLQGMTHCSTFRWAAQFGVGISRLTPAMPPRAGVAPRVEQMNAAAQISSDDAELLLALTFTFDEVGADVNITTPEPQGGYQAVMLTITIPAFGGLD